MIPSIVATMEGEADLGEDFESYLSRVSVGLAIPYESGFEEPFAGTDVAFEAK